MTVTAIPREGKTRGQVPPPVLTTANGRKDAPLGSAGDGIRTVREDWKLFGNLETLPQKAGTPLDLIPRLVAKELADNAIDVAGDCEYGELPGGGFFVQDAGPGFEGSDEEVAAMFSTGRSLVSTKQSRRLTLGALGTGLRVVAGAVLASRGRLTVHTAGRRLDLEPRHDGTTAVLSSAPSEVCGTRVEVVLGGRLADVEDNVFAWAGVAKALARAVNPSAPTKSPSVHWHDADSFADLLRDAAPGLTVRQLLETFDGLSGAKASAVAADFRSRAACGLTRKEAAALFRRAREAARELSHTALGRVGELAGWGRSKVDDTTIRRGDAAIPVRIEVWARATDGGNRGRPCA